MATKQNFNAFWDSFANNPFAQSFGSLADFNNPSFDINSIAAAQRKNSEAFAEAAKVTFEGIQAAAQCQMNNVSNTVQDTLKFAKDAASGNPEDIAKSCNMAFENAIANAKDVADITSKSAMEACDIVSKRLAELSSEVGAKNSPSANASNAAAKKKAA